MLSRYKNARISVSGGTDISGASSGGGGRGGGGGSTNRLNMIVQGPDMDQLQAYSSDLLARIKEIPGVTDADTSFETTQPELRITIDRQRAADIGVPLESVSSSLRTLVGGQEVSKFKDGDEQYTVLLRLDEQFRRDPRTMGDLFVQATGGRMVRVSDVARLTMENAPASIERYNRMRQFSVNANLDPRADDAGHGPVGRPRQGRRTRVEGRLSGDVRRQRQDARRGAERLRDRDPPGDRLHLHGAGVAVQLVHPSPHDHDRAAAEPAGGLLALMAFGMTINVYSAIGLMMLFGIVKKNSILQVDYTNTLRAEGLDRHTALVQASHVRLRPILMTTIAIVAGMLPIAFGRGAGIRVARVDGRDHHRRPVVVPAADAARHPGHLLVLRRVANVEAERPAGTPSVPEAGSGAGSRAGAGVRAVAGDSPARDTACLDGGAGLRFCATATYAGRLRWADLT